MADIDPTTLPQSRAEARAVGTLHYFTGKPCRQGHRAPRIVSNDHCTVCGYAASASWRERNPDRVKANWKRWRSSDRGREIASASVALWRSRDPKRTWASAAVSSAKRRAAAVGMEYALSYRDVLPLCGDRCPALGISLDYGAKGQKGARANSPTIDRLDNDRGYTPDNIAVISYRANSIKQAATAAEIRRVADWLETALG
jgi:hypothetical protein